MSLKKQLEELGVGGWTVTDHARKGIYTAAARANVKIETEALPDGKTKVTVMSSVHPGFRANTLLEQLRGMERGERLDILKHFEPCCGARKGACVCDEIVVENPVDLRCDLCLEPLLNGCNCWEFDPDAKVDWNNDNGNVYRRQRFYTIREEKYIYRSVRVDNDDIERVVEITKNG